MADIQTEQGPEAPWGGGHTQTPTEDNVQYSTHERACAHSWRLHCPPHGSLADHPDPHGGSHAGHFLPDS